MGARWCCPVILSVVALSTAHGADVASDASEIRVAALEVAAPDPTSTSDAISRTRRPGTTIFLLVQISDGHVVALDTVRSAITELTDDRGMDLLAAGQRIEEAGDQGREGQAVSFRFGAGVGNGLELTRVTDGGAGVVAARSLALPPVGATGLRLRGRLVLTVGRNAVTEDLPDVELKSGTLVRLGKVQGTLRESGSDQSWRVVSDDPLDAVIEVQAIGPDGNALGTFGAGNVKGFFTPPGARRVTLRVRRYGHVTRDERPFDLTVGLGFAAGAENAGAARTAAPVVAAPACVNPYFFPDADGGRWTYEESNQVHSLAGGAGDEVHSTTEGTTTVSRRPTSQASLNEQWRLRGEGIQSSSSVSWDCLTEGLRVSPDVAIAMLVPADDLGPWKDTGVDVPPAAAWHVGAKWRRVAEASNGTGSGAAVRRVVLSASYEIVARERVTVPAGTYDAFKVEGVATVDAEGAEVHGMRLSTATTAWYAHGVGIVRSRTVSTVQPPTPQDQEPLAGGIRVERVLALKDFSGR